ncbi:transport protein SEC31-like protein, partial [Thalictrum thalictroides]
SEGTEGALVARHPKHAGPVRGLEFNIHNPNLLASGAVEGEICIWDLARPTEPSHYPPLKNVGAGAQGEVSFLSWNQKVQHILASTSYNGTTVVWDLKRQKPVISFADSNRRRCSVLQWNPDVATQLIVASDDDASPSLRLWDVRNTISPVKEFVGHTKGVIAMSWCPIDSSFLLTCAKDNRTICWDTVTGEIVCELPVGTNWNFDIHWYPKIPGLISASSFDGKIGIYNIEACSRFTSGEADFGGANLRAPKWLKRSVGASFGFGGKLVSFHPSQSVGGNSEVYVHDLVTELSLVDRSSEFEAAMQNGEKSALRVLCDKKSQESKSQDDRETWGFLKVMFEDDGTARTKLLTHLGFSVLDNNGHDELPQEMNGLGLDERIDKTDYAVNKEDNTFPTDNGEDFFNNLQSPRADPSISDRGDGFVLDGGVLPSEEQLHQELEGQGENNSSSFDESIQRALVVGDYKGAVSQCISANRMADALVIANVGGASLWETTRDQYLKRSHSSYLKVLYAMVNNDLTSLVNTRPLNSWKETLALLCTFAERKEWTVLCGTLASRLMAVGDTLAATLCYICAGNIDKTVEIWSHNLKPEHEGRTYVDLLQDLMEKTIVLAFATGQKQFSASLSKLVQNYAELLASQGLLSTAMEYLKLLDSEESSQELAILRDRIAFSSQDKEAPKTESTQLQTKPVYGTDQSGFGLVDGSQNYYQATQPHQNIPGNSYSDTYQQQPYNTYGGGYVASTLYQPAQPTHIFRPHPQPPQGPQGNISSIPTQPPVGKFSPSQVPVLKNVESYQQPTLGSHLYPGIGNATYQTVSTGPPNSGQALPGQNLPPVSAITPNTVGSSGFVQRPGMGLMQPPSPPAPTQVAPAAAPPPTVQTVDTSNVPAQQRTVVTTLTKLFNETSEALGGSRANPGRKREIDDNSRKIGALFAKLNSGDISKNAADKLVQLCHALDMGDFGTALQLQVLLTTSEWDECNFWLATLKRMIKTRQSVRIN